MSFRFVHMADLHLDSPFAGRPEQRKLLRSLQEEAFRAGVELALREHVHALIISGDLADGENLSYGVTLMLYQSFTRLLEAGISVVYAYGNHDPAQNMTRLALPKDVIVFSSMDPACITLYDDSRRPVAQVVGVGYEKNYEEEFPLMRFPARGLLPIVGVAHTQLTDYSGAGTGYAPVSSRALEMLGYDYWALGHIHQFMRVGDHMAYPGVLSGRDYGETGEKGVLLVEVEARQTPKVTFCPLSRAGFWDMEVAGTAHAADLTQLNDLLFTQIQDQLPSVLPKASMVRLTLKGVCPCARELIGPMGQENIAALEGDLRRRLFVTEVKLRVLDLAPPVDLETYAREKHILGEALTMLSQAETQDDVLESILRELQDIRLAGCDSLRTDALMAYARELLPDLYTLVARRMIKEEHT